MFVSLLIRKSYLSTQFKILGLMISVAKRNKNLHIFLTNTIKLYESVCVRSPYNDSTQVMH